MLLQFFFVGGSHGNRIEDRINCDTSELLLLCQRNAELLKGAQEFRIDLVEARFRGL